MKHQFQNKFIRKVIILACCLSLCLQPVWGQEGDRRGTGEGLSPIKAEQAAEFQTMLGRLDSLETLAKQYYNSLGWLSKLGTSANRLTFNYVRCGNPAYTDELWVLLAGSDSTGFNDYVAKNSPDIAELKKIRNFTLPNGETTDFSHMFATLSMETGLFDDIGGWAGDLYQLAGDIPDQASDAALLEKAKQLFRGNSSFGVYDWIADLDAYNVYRSKKSGETWAQCFARYFTQDLTEYKRVEQFTKQKLGSTYWNDSTTKDQIRAAVKNKSASALDTMAWGYDKIGRAVPSDAKITAAQYTVGDYIFEVLHRVPDFTGPAMIYNGNVYAHVEDGVEKVYVAAYDANGKQVAIKEAAVKAHASVSDADLYYAPLPTDSSIDSIKVLRLETGFIPHYEAYEVAE